MHTPGSPDSWFDTFYAIASRHVWNAHATTRARIFHGGVPCEQHMPPALQGGRRASENNTMCADCSSFHTQTVWVIGEKFQRQTADGNRLDPVRFATANAQDRFDDTVLKEDGAAHGVLQKPKRTVFESNWIDDALDGDDDAKDLLYLYLRFVQGRDPVEAGSPLPYQRWAAKLGIPHHGTRIENRLAEIIEQLRHVRPDWVEKNLDAHTRHLTGHTLIDDDTTTHDNGDPVAEQLPDPRVTIGDDHHLELTLTADTLALAINHPLAPTHPDHALTQTIARVWGPAAAHHAQQHPDWTALTDHVHQHADRPAA